MFLAKMEMEETAFRDGQRAEKLFRKNNLGGSKTLISPRNVGITGCFLEVAFRKHHSVYQTISLSPPSHVVSYSLLSHCVSQESTARSGAKRNSLGEVSGLM